MNTNYETNSCGIVCWLGAAGLAFIGFFLALVVGGWPFMASAFASAALFVFVGVFTSLLICPSGFTKATRHASAPGANKPVPKPAPTKAAPAAPAPAPAAAPATSAKAAAQPAVVAAAALPGQAELASRKGSWRYEADAKDAPDADPDRDGDGIAEGVNEGTKPATLSAARGGVADDLKRIKGIGPKLEILCNELGFYHFDQIAAWTPDEVAWVDSNLEGFKGRVTRDTWVDQAKLLAAGGETEFSQKVDKGDVY